MSSWLAEYWHNGNDKNDKQHRNDTEAPWDQPNDNGEKPGDICCQRSTGGRCYEHNPENYPNIS
jgi:hypothetical protein